jgi:hypothetical protein
MGEPRHVERAAGRRGGWSLLLVLLSSPVACSLVAGLEDPTFGEPATARPVDPEAPPADASGTTPDPPPGEVDSGGELPRAEAGADTGGPEAGLPPATSVRCGVAKCSGATPICCSTTAKCIAVGGSCTGATITCDGASDCGPGQICCLDPVPDSATCRIPGECAAVNMLIVCTENADCLGDRCGVPTEVDSVEYLTCP